MWSMVLCAYMYVCVVSVYVTEGVKARLLEGVR